MAGLVRLVAASQCLEMFVIRAVAATDEAAWRELWAGYLDFYAESLDDGVTSATWRRILDPASPVFARVAEVDGRVVGFSVNVLHEGTWSTAHTCYLEDLFVSPEARGRGVGHALIQDLVDMGRIAGWARLYWMTEEGNPARRLYDRFAPADGYVRYRLKL
jgi:GNAT superfamily N-acetyltransferase